MEDSKSNPRSPLKLLQSCPNASNIHQETDGSAVKDLPASKVACVAENKENAIKVTPVNSPSKGLGGKQTAGLLKSIMKNEFNKRVFSNVESDSEYESADESSMIATPSKAVKDIPQKEDPFNFSFLNNFDKMKLDESSVKLNEMSMSENYPNTIDMTLGNETRNLVLSSDEDDDEITIKKTLLDTTEKLNESSVLTIDDTLEADQPSVIEQQTSYILQTSRCEEHPIVNDQKYPSVEEQAAPIVEEQAAPIVEEQAAPIVEEQAAPSVEEQAAPSVEEQAAPSVEEQAAPSVEEKTAPSVEEKTAPSVEEKTAPIVEEKAAPIVEEKAAPIVEEKAAPIVEEKAAPIVEEQAAPSVEEQAAPSVEEQAAPIVEEQAAPSVEEQAAPSVEEQAAPSVEEKTAPSVEEKAAPSVEEKAAPIVEEKAAPIVEEKAAPIVEEQAAPIVEEQAAPSVEEQAAPSVEEQAAPSVEEQAAPSVEEQAAPSVEEQAAPSVEEQAAPSVEEQAAPSVEEQAAPSVEEQTAPSVEEKAAPSVEEKAAPSVEEKAAPIVEEKAAPIVEEKAAPSVEEQAAPSVEEQAAPSVEDQAAPSVEEQVVPCVEKKTSPIVEEQAAPIVEEQAAPIVEEQADPIVEEQADPVVEEQAAAPVVEEQAAAPVVEEQAAAPVVEEQAAAAVVEEQAAAAVVEEQAAAAVVEEQAAAAVVEEQAAAPVVEEQAAAPVVEEQAAAPVVEEQAAAPVVEELAAAPVVEELAAAPVVEELAAAPVVEELAAAPVVEELAAAPVVEELAAAPVVEELAAAPVVEEQAATSVVEEQAATSVVEEQAVAPVVEEQAVAPVVEEQAVAPVVEEQAAAPVVEEQAVAPVVEEQAAAPVVEEQAAAPVVEEQAAAPVVEEQAAAPVVEEQAAAPVVEEQAAAPVVEEQAAAPVVEEQAAAPVVEEQAAAPVVEEQAAAPVVEEQAVAPVVEEQAAAPVVEEQAAAPVVEEQADVSLTITEKDSVLSEQMFSEISVKQENEIVPNVCDSLDDGSKCLTPTEDKISNLKKKETKSDNSKKIKLPDHAPCDPLDFHEICKRTYTLDDLENPAFNPFASKTGIPNSPVASSSVSESIATLPEPFDIPKPVDILPEPVDILPEPVDILPEPVDILPEPVDILPEPIPTKNNAEEKLIEPEVNSVQTEKTVDSDDEFVDASEDMPLPSTKGAYNLDFLDKLDAANFNPFDTSASLANSPIIDAKSHSKNENDTHDNNNEGVESSDNSLNDTVIENIIEDVGATAGKEDISEAIKGVSNSDETKGLDDCKTIDDGIVEDVPVKQYDLSFLDKIESVSELDPFKTKSAVVNSPIAGIKEDSDISSPVSSKSSKTNEAIKDPFKSQSSVQNSPLNSGMIASVDPFKTKATIQNSPVTSVKAVDAKHSTKANISPIPSSKDAKISTPPPSNTSCTSEVFKTPTLPGKNKQLHRIQHQSSFKQNKDSVSSSPNISGMAVDTDISSINNSCLTPNSEKKPTDSEEKFDGEKTDLAPLTDFCQTRKVRQSMTSIEFDELSNNALALVYKITPDRVPGERRLTMSGANKRLGSSSKTPTSSKGSFGCTPSQLGTPEGFTDATEFFRDPLELDELAGHGTSLSADSRLNLVRNSLYVKFDPLVAGRPSLIQKDPSFMEIDAEDESKRRRASGLISFSPSPQKIYHPDTAGFSLLDTVNLDSTGINSTLIEVSRSGETSFAPTVAKCSRCSDSKENWVPESELRNLELALQADHLRKVKEYEQQCSVLTSQLEEQTIVCEDLNDRNKESEATLKQLQVIVSKIIQQKGLIEKEHTTELDNQREVFNKEVENFKEKNKFLESENNKLEETYYDHIQKYHRLRDVANTLHENELKLKTQVNDLQAKLVAKNEQVRELIKSVDQKLKEAEAQADEENSKHEQEKNKMSIIVKRLELKLTSMQNQLAEKEKENDELQKILDHFGKI